MANSYVFADSCSKAKTMADVRRIVDLYELRKSCKKVARELNISRKTVKKYLRRVKDEIVRWNRTNASREVYILQEPRVGQRAEFDWGEATLNIR